MEPNAASHPAPYRPPGRFLPLKLLGEEVYENVCQNLCLRGYHDLVRHVWQELTFDLHYGVATRGKVAVGDLSFGDVPVQMHASPYHASPPFCVRNGLERLKYYLPDFEAVSFVDYGCGKGRVMILASEAGFKEIIGLEMSPPLAEICAKNLHAHSTRRPQASHLTVLIENAATFTPPPSAGVFFFFNPFDAAIFQKVLHQIADSIRRQPRTVYLLTLGTVYDVEWAGFRLIDQVTSVMLYANG